MPLKTVSHSVTLHLDLLDNVCLSIVRQEKNFLTLTTGKVLLSSSFMIDRFTHVKKFYILHASNKKLL